MSTTRKNQQTSPRGNDSLSPLRPPLLQSRTPAKKHEHRSETVFVRERDLRPGFSVSSSGTCIRRSCWETQRVLWRSPWCTVGIRLERGCSEFGRHPVSSFWLSCYLALPYYISTCEECLQWKTKENNYIQKVFKTVAIQRRPITKSVCLHVMQERIIRINMVVCKYLTTLKQFKWE